MSSTPILSAIEEEEDLFLYLAVSDVAVSAVVVREEEGRKNQCYMRRMLLDAETRYNATENNGSGLSDSEEKTAILF